MKKGRVLSLLLTLPLLLSVPPAMADSHVFLQDGTVELEYVLLDDGTVEITHYSGTATTLEFPDTLDGRPVSTISTIAFYDIAFHEDDIQTLTDITIPASVTVIGDNVFHTCADLTNITVSADNPCFTSIDGVLFRKTGGALVAYPAGRQDTAYSIPKGTASIGDYAFYGCEQLEDITVPDSVTEIGEEAFCGCASLTDIAVPDSVAEICEFAFGGGHFSYRYCRSRFRDGDRHGRF